MIANLLLITLLLKWSSRIHSFYPNKIDNDLRGKRNVSKNSTVSSITVLALIFVIKVFKNSIKCVREN